MKNSMISVDTIQNSIYLVRGQRVMLDRNLAAMYCVPTKALKQAVRRNATRFPDDFMFVLSLDEFTVLRSQIVTSKTEPRGGAQYAPMAFTEQGVATQSSVLNSERAIQVNIAIMRTFTQSRQMLATHTELARKMDELEKKYDAQFSVVFDAIRQLMTPPDPPRKKIGFHVRESKPKYASRKPGEH